MARSYQLGPARRAVNAVMTAMLRVGFGMVGWVHNVRTTPEVSLRRGKRSVQLRAEEVDPETAGPILRQYARNVRVTAPFSTPGPASQLRSS
jgi:hypothetical protein